MLEWLLPSWHHHTNPSEPGDCPESCCRVSGEDWVDVEGEAESLVLWRHLDTNAQARL